MRRILIIILAFSLLIPTLVSAEELSKDIRAECHELQEPLPVQPANMLAVDRILKDVGLNVKANRKKIDWIFNGKPEKTKMEQFFQFLYFFQQQKETETPIVIGRPYITDILVSAKVFTRRTFPDRITSVKLVKEGGVLRWQIFFDQDEARYPLNDGNGFESWEHNKCQHIQELVLHSGFSFKIKEFGGDLYIYDFEGTEVYGSFGARGVLNLDVNYVEFVKVQFLSGTKMAKIKSRVANREYEHNSHTFLFKLVGRLIPDTSKHRIDW